MMRVILRVVIGLTLFLCAVLGILVFAPRALYGAPAQGWLTYSLCRIRAGATFAPA